MRKNSLLLLTLLSSLLPSLVLAHPGHGLGPLGHDLQHSLWSFMGLALLAATLLIADKLFISHGKLLQISLRHYAVKAREFLSSRNTKG